MKTEITPHTMGWPEDFSLEKVGMSQSLWKIWEGCNRHLLFVINGYEGRQKKEKYLFGEIVHDILDQAYHQTKVPDNEMVNDFIQNYIVLNPELYLTVDKQLIEYELAKAEATMTVYFEFYKDDYENKLFRDIERPFDSVWYGLRMRGKKDGAYFSNASKWNLEHKSMGRIDDTLIQEYLPMDFQNKYYIVADHEKPVGTLYNVIRNTSSKPLKSETLHQWKAKLETQILKDPEYYFKRFEQPYTKNDIFLFEQNLNIKINDLNSKIGKFVFPNTSNCMKPYRCPFLQNCRNNNMNGLKKKPGKCNDYLFQETKERTDASSDTKIKATRPKIKAVRRK